jgi:spermidine synthase
VDLVAAAVLLAARPVPPPSEASRRRVMELATGRTGPVLLALLLSGAATLALEIVWARTLGMLLGTSVYALGTVLATFVVGLGIGAGIASAQKGWLSGREAARRLLAASLALGALLTFAAHAFVPLLPGVVSRLSEALVESPRLLQLSGAGICSLLLLPAAVALGAAFPAGLALVAGGEGSAGRAASRAYAASAIGSLAGSLAAAAWAVPVLGLRGALLAAVLLQLGAAAVAMASGRSSVEAWIVLAAAALVLPFLPFRWAPETIASGPFLYGPRIQGEVLFHRDGREATVTVARDGPWLSMRVNGKVDASTRGDLETQRLLAHLGVLLHGEPRDVLVIGLASGITAGSVLTHPEVERVTCVELEPAVVEASSWFRAWNGTALGDPRLDLVIGDGRAHMARHRGAYDLVVSEPSNPWMAGVADLFTREAFEAARASLREEGVFVQWVQAYGLEPGDIRAIARTFRGVFPDATLWAVGRDLTDLALVGGPGVGRDLDRVRSVLATDGTAAQELRLSGILRPTDLTGRLLVAGDGMSALAGLGSVLRDDHPWLEYTGPLHVRDVSLYGKNLRLLRGARTRPWRWFDLDAAAAGEATALHRARERFLDALEAVARGDDARYESGLREAIALDPNDADAARLLARLHTSRGFGQLEEGRSGAAFRELEEASRTDPFYPIPHLTLGALYEREGELAAAALRYEAYLRLYPFDPDGWSRLAAVYAAMGEAEQAALANERARSLRPGPPGGPPAP